MPVLPIGNRRAERFEATRQEILDVAWELVRVDGGTSPRWFHAASLVFNPGPPYDEEWTRGYLIDVIHTRDPWGHRIDICRATRSERTLTSDHDGHIVADAVAEWARRHGQPCTVVLDGPAGGIYTHGEGGAQLHLDAVHFCHTLSGRAPADGLLAHQVPF